MQSSSPTPATRMKMRQFIALWIYLCLSSGTILIVLGLIGYISQPNTITPHLAYLGTLLTGLGLFALLWLYKITQQES